MFACDVKNKPIEGIDFVHCKLCNFKAKTLTKHITQTHKISKKDYESQFLNAQISCRSSISSFKDRGQNFAWLKRAKERGDDLTAYKRKLSKAVSLAIMSNSEERSRRSRQMSENNRTQDARQRSRITAKKTSSRPDVLLARTRNLERWRNENFEEFYDKCIRAAQSTWQSKPEKKLFEFLLTVQGYDFKHNQVIKSEKFTNSSKRKQIDIADKIKRVYVEFDGIMHFSSAIKGEEAHNKTVNLDKLLNDHIVQHGWTLIRVSYDQFSYKNGGVFSDRCIEQLLSLLKDPKPGVHCIGDSYHETKR